MKEATVEINLAVIVMISIGVLMAFFFGVLWPMLDFNFTSTAQCNKAVCNCSEESIRGLPGLHEVEGIMYCTCWDDEEEDRSSDNSFDCLYRG